MPARLKRIRIFHQPHTLPILQRNEQGVLAPKIQGSSSHYHIIFEVKVRVVASGLFEGCYSSLEHLHRHGLLTERLLPIPHPFIRTFDQFPLGILTVSLRRNSQAGLGPLGITCHFLQKIGLEYIADEGLKRDVVPILLWHSLPHSVISRQGSQETTRVLDHNANELRFNRSGLVFQQTCNRCPSQSHQVCASIEHGEVLEHLGSGLIGTGTGHSH